MTTYFEIFDAREKADRFIEHKRGWAIVHFEPRYTHDRESWGATCDAARLAIWLGDPHAKLVDHTRDLGEFAK
jgi:hypothetical protein